MIIKKRLEIYLQSCCESGKPFGVFVEDECYGEVESWEEYADEVAYRESDECDFYYLSGVKDGILFVRG